MILLSSSLNSFIQLLGVLLIFLFVLVITYFTTKWIGGYQKVQMSGRSFQVVDTIRIANNKLVQYIFEHKDSENVPMFCEQLYDLALLSHGTLSPERMTSFIARSNEIMMEMVDVSK